MGGIGFAGVLGCIVHTLCSIAHARNALEACFTPGSRRKKRTNSHVYRQSYYTPVVISSHRTDERRFLAIALRSHGEAHGHLC